MRRVTMAQLDGLALEISQTTGRTYRVGRNYGLGWELKVAEAETDFSSVVKICNSRNDLFDWMDAFCAGIELGIQVEAGRRPLPSARPRKAGPPAAGWVPAARRIDIEPANPPEAK